MTDPSSQAAPGWYPVAAGSTQLRWWDGTKWTEHLHETGRDGMGYQVQAPPKAPEGTNPNTVFGWLIPLTPLLGVVALPIYFASIGNAFATFYQQTLDNPRSLQSTTAFYSAILSPTYFAVLFLGLVGYALAIIFAYRDWKALAAKGVSKPFHWAWTFLSAPYVYIIGRSVIVHRRTGRGLGPLWVLIGVFVVSGIVSLVGYAIAVGPMLSAMSRLR